MTFTRQDVLAVGTIALIATVTLINPSFAQDASSISGAAGLGTGTGSNSNLGAGFATTVAQALKGNIGLAVGVASAAFGAYQWLVKQNTGVGIGAILFGAVLALVPNLMTGLYNNVTAPIISNLGGGAVNTNLGR